MKTRAGFTLIELIVVLVILGIVGAISGAAMRHPPATARTGSREMAIEHIANARRLAVTQGKPVTVTVRISASDSTELLAREVTARPDGSVVADPDLGIDRLSGRPARTDGHRR